MRPGYCTFLFLVVLSVETVVYANLNVQKVPYRFDHLTSQEGLSMGLVTALAQDGEGFIWVGTQNGLNRFDGYSVRTYFHERADDSSLSHSFVWALHRDQANRFWVGTRDGLNKYDPNNDGFSRYMSGIEVKSISSRRAGGLWIGTTKGMFIITDDEPKKILPAHVKGVIRSIYEDSYGRVWVCSEGNGLRYLLPDLNTDSYTLHKTPFDVLSAAHIRSIVEDDSRNLWVGTYDEGLVYLRGDLGSSHKVISEKQGALSMRVRALLFTSSGNLMVGSDAGVEVFDPRAAEVTSHFTSTGDAGGIVDRSVNKLFEDEGGVIWIGTFNGVSRTSLRPQAFKWYASEAKNESLLTLHQSRDGSLLAGTFSGVYKWANDFSSYEHFSASSLGFVDPRVSAFEEFDGHLWIGTMTDGLHRVKSLGDKDFTKYRHNPNDVSSLSSNAVTDVLVDQDGQLWVATYGGGLNLYLANGKFRRFPDLDNPEGRFSSEFCLSIADDRRGNLWIATDGGGVVVLNKKTGDTKAFRAGLDAATLVSDYLMSATYTDAGMWLASVDNGVSLFDFARNTFSRPGYKKLSGQPVNSILEYKGGVYWLNTINSVVSLNIATGSLQSFNLSHGVQPSDFNSNVAAKLRSSEFVFGGNGGLTAFNPASVHRNSHEPKMVITKLEIDNQEHTVGRRLSESILNIGPMSKSIGFQFSALDFMNPSANHYKYKLSGFDQDWIDNGTDRDVTYTNLDPGNYTFHVIGSNNDGVWNEKGLSVPIVVQPPPWATWWAYTLYVLTAAMLSYLFYWWSARRKEIEAEARFNRRMELYVHSLDETSECVMNANHDGSVLFANTTSESVLDRSAGELIGYPLFDIIFQDEESRQTALSTLQDTGKYQTELSYTSDFMDKVLEVSISTVPDSLDEVAYVGVVRDVTARSYAREQQSADLKLLQQTVEEKRRELEETIAQATQVERRLRESNEEKALLLEGFHDRANDNLQMLLSLLSIQSSKVKDEHVLRLLEDSQQRVRAISLVHEHIHDASNLRGVDMQSYLDSLTSGLFRRLSPDGVNVHFEKLVENIVLDIEQAVPCGLIINELLVNALEHGFAEKKFGSGKVTLRLETLAHDCVVVVSDDGRGLPTNFSIDGTGSMGMEIVSVLVTQLGGGFRLIGGLGTTFEVRFHILSR